MREGRWFEGGGGVAEVAILVRWNMRRRRVLTGGVVAVMAAFATAADALMTER